MEIKIKKMHPDAKIPQYMREGDAAFDLHSVEETTLQAGEKKIIRSGIAVEIPKGYAGLFWDRSGLAAKHGLHTLAGVLDSNYRGELMVVMINHGKEPYTIEKHERICQVLVHPVATVQFQEVDELSDSQRGEARFGSTGRQ